MPLTWPQLLAEHRVQNHETSRRELDDLRAVVARDLADAGVPELSDDRRYATAYNAALQLAKMAIACAGYRVTAIAHHRSTFEALPLAMGPELQQIAWYFDTCRRKRNVVDYDHAYITTEVETSELLRNVHDFQTRVETWIAEKYPELAAGDSPEASSPKAA